MNRVLCFLFAASTAISVFADADSVPVSLSSLQLQASRFAGMYFAPMCGLGFYRLRDPQTGIVEFRQEASGAFVGAGGWSAEVKGKGETIGIRPPADDPGYGFEFLFAAGEPVKFVSGGKEYKISVDAEDKVCHGDMPVMWDESGSDDLNLLNRKWPGRFTLFYVNPNRAGVLFASAALVFFALFLSASRRWLMVAGALGTIAGTIPTVMTLSRAALLGLGIGGLILLVGRFFRSGGRKRIAAAIGVAVLIGAVFLYRGGYGRLSLGKNSGDVTRELVWREVPRMMYSAPWGVRGVGVGSYYTDWFLPLEKHFITGSVINSHFDAMIKSGWLGAFFWMFGWFGGLLALALWIRRGGNALPLAMWTMFGIAGVFNPVLNSWTLWLIPVAVLPMFFRTRPWREWRVYGIALLLGAVISVGFLYHYVTKGAKDTKNQLVIETCGGRTMVNGSDPKVWVVDDGETLGWVQTAKEIRYYYAARPNSPALGYVRDLKLVPVTARRVVVAGKQCRRYVELFEKGEAPRAREVIFISPPFGVKGVPFDLHTSCVFRMLIGEFAQRYVDVYGENFSPSWVITVPGSELYVPGWVGYALGGL